MSTATAPSISSVDSPVAASTDRLAAARERFAPLFAEIAAGAASREASRELPVDEVRRLAAAGFGALRLDVSEGGGGLTAGELVELLIDLGAADANLPQIWRNHIAFVEDRLWHREGGACLLYTSDAADE